MGDPAGDALPAPIPTARHDRIAGRGARREPWGRIRRATADDAPAIGHVHAAAAADMERDPSLPRVARRGESAEARAARWRTRLHDSPPGFATLVAEDIGGGVVGFCHVGPSPDDGGAGTGPLHALYVLPEAAGQGIGGALLEAGLAHLADARFAEATLWVLSGNRAARRFYEARGWAADGAVSEDASADGFVVSVRYRRRLR